MSHTPSTAPRLDAQRVTRAIGAVLAVGAVAAVVWAAAAGFSYARAGDASLPLTDRYAAATRALSLAPWIPAVRARQGYLRSQVLFRAGKILGAVDVMAEAYRDAVGDPQMLAWFKKVQDALALDTNRKAHLQHGHEGPGGTLTPGAVER
jgi:hypothetical protein